MVVALLVEAFYHTGHVHPVVVVDDVAALEGTGIVSCAENFVRMVRLAAGRGSVVSLPLL